MGRREMSRQLHRKKKSRELHGFQAKVKTGWSNSGVSPDTSPRSGHTPFPGPQPSLLGTEVPAPGGALGHRGGWRARKALTRTSSPFLSGRLGENSQHHSRSLHASSSPAQAPPPPEAPLGSRLTPTPSSSPRPPPLSPPQNGQHPAALTCEPSPGPSISPLAATTLQSGRDNPLASSPRTAFTPTSCLRPRLRRGPRRAQCRQSPSGEPIPALPGWGRDFPLKLLGTRESEAPPLARPRRVLPAPGQDRAVLAGVGVHRPFTPQRAPHTGPGSGCYSKVTPPPTESKCRLGYSIAS